MATHFWSEARRIVAASAALVALLVLGVPTALGATTWYEIGTGSSPVNHDALSDASNPLLALVGSTPHLGWNEADTVNGTPTGQVRISSLTGSPVDPRPWAQLSNSTDPNAPGSLNLDATHPARDIHLTNIGGVPYAAWIESDGTADQVRVARWTGTTWELVGSGPLNTTGAAPGGVAIVGLAGSRTWRGWRASSISLTSSASTERTGSTPGLI